MLNKKEDKIIEGIYTEKKYKKPVKFVATAAMIDYWLKLIDSLHSFL